MDNMVTLTIDGVEVTVPEGTTVLEAAHQANIHIPTLCYLKGVNQIGACRMCIVDTGARNPIAACTLPAANGMNVRTNTPAIREARRNTLELILSNHDRECTTCVRSQNCELQSLAKELGIVDIDYPGENIHYDLDKSSKCIVRDPNKCVLCRRCIATCQQVQNVGVLGATERGFKTIVSPVFHMGVGEVPCIGCGQCIQACPVGAIYEVDDTKKVWKALANPDLHVVVHTAPSIRVGLGEELGMPMGTNVTGKMVAALRRMGFDSVLDTDFAADLTIMEEGTEFLHRLNEGGTLPMITSCSPGWIKYCEHYYPEFIDNLSTCKSPMSMQGAIIKTYYAQKMGIDPKNIFTVAVMPCTAKKFECSRTELAEGDMADNDAVLTTRELGRMIRQSGIRFETLPDEDFDSVMGESTGAAVIFGVTGGVMEAALRTVYEVATGKELEDVNFTEVRGIQGVKEASVKVGDREVRVAVAHGTGNASKLLDSIKSGEKQYDFIEIMGCPGGCVTGGGQPIVPAEVKMDVDPRQVRAAAIYSADEAKVHRKSHENSEIKALYKDFLGEPGSHKAHEILHTSYVKRGY